MTKNILALDQGTTSSRAIVFDHDGSVVSQAQQEFAQILPSPGHVEHDPEAIWSSQLEVARQALAHGQVAPSDVASVGVTNQRETVILWRRSSGKPVANAIVWQSRISAEICEDLIAAGYEDLVREKTGLLIDPYFSGTKVKYLLDKHDGLREQAARGEILFGTVDTFLVWRLTGGRRHVTDPSNASRTMVYNIHTLSWDEELLAMLDIPPAMLPDVVPSSGVCGAVAAEHLGAEIPIAGIAGDQQAASFGQACFQPGEAKNTYGTGCFLLLNTGTSPVQSQNKLLSTVAWQLGDEVTYCLEGSIFVGGAAVQWLRDGLGLIESSGDIERLAASVDDSGGVYFVPAFVGLGAPHWDPYARGAVFGITRSTTAGHLAKAVVESMAHQSCDVLEAMQNDSGVKLSTLKVDGGASINDALMQFQADLLETVVERPVVAETTALGAAYLAGLATGYWQDLQELSQNWALGKRFDPGMDAELRRQRRSRWAEAVQRSLRWDAPATR